MSLNESKMKFYRKRRYPIISILTVFLLISPQILLYKDNIFIILVCIITISFVVLNSVLVIAFPDYILAVTTIEIRYSAFKERKKICTEDIRNVMLSDDKIVVEAGGIYEFNIKNIRNNRSAFIEYFKSIG